MIFNAFWICFNIHKLTLFWLIYNIFDMESEDNNFFKVPEEENQISIQPS